LGYIPVQGTNATVELGELNLPDDSMLHVDSSGNAEAISDVAVGQVLKSQGTTSIPIWSGTIQMADGSIAAPSYAFATEPDTGLFFVSANTLALSVNGVGTSTQMQLTTASWDLIVGGTLSWRMTETTLGGIGTGKAEIFLAAGNTTTPVYSFDTDNDTGMSRSAANQLSLITGGTEAINIDSSQVVTLSTLEIKGGIKLTKLTKIHEEFFESSGVTSNVPTGTGWTFTDVLGTGSGAMVDAIDGGYAITSGGTDGDNSSITMNDVRQFDPTNCTIHGIITLGQTGENKMACGISDGANPVLAANHVAVLRYLAQTGSAVVFTLVTSGGSAITAVSTDITGTTNLTPFKIICDSTNVRLFLLVNDIWTLKATGTTNLPSTKCQPIFNSGTDETAARTNSVQRLRVQND